MQLIKTLKEKSDGKYPFHMPGHKRRLFDDEIFSDIYSVDVTETEDFDDLHEAEGILKEAQEKAAKLYGADETHFLVNGSTGGILAAICATVTSNDSVVVAANCHRSVFNAVMLSGADLYVVTPGREKCFDICGGVDPDFVQRALADTGAKGSAVVITSPTYEGIVSDIRAIADICHAHGAVLIVDSAHGAHLGFSDDFPASPVASGADVVISGIHKTMPAMTQTALIHISSKCLSKDRIRKMLTVFSTSSPSYVLMASADSMTHLLAEKGTKLFNDYGKRLRDFYLKASGLKCLTVLDDGMLCEKGSAGHDPGKLVIKDKTGRLSGKELYDILKDEYGLCAEMAGFSYVILMTSVADTDEGFRRLEEALADIDKKLSLMPPADKKAKIPETVFIAEGKHDNNMMAAMFSEGIKHLPVEEAAGRTAADIVTVYPPGIPVTLPGDVITKEAVNSLINAIDCGLKVTGLNNKEIAVLWERYST